MRDARRQRGREIAIDLDDVQPFEPFDERRRQRTRAAADLDHEVGRLRTNRVDQLADDARVVQEMLAEPLLRAHRAAQTSSIASSTAANRLSGRARPVPASGSAVP